MFTLIVKAASEVTDMDWLKRRIEAMNFEVVRIEDQLIVQGRSYTSGANHFMLCDMLQRNMPLLVTYKVSDEVAEEQRKLEEGVPSSHTLMCQNAIRSIVDQDPT